MWYVVQTSVGMEHTAVEKCSHALEKNMVTQIFTPEIEVKKHYLKEWHTKLQVMFPGYVFLESSARSRELEKLLWRISGVVKPVKIGGDFNPITAEEEAFLREMMDENHFIRISVGDIIDGELIIRNGPLNGKTAYVKKIDRHRRLAMLDISLWKEDRSVPVGLEVVYKLTRAEYEQKMGA